MAKVTLRMPSTKGHPPGPSVGHCTPQGIGALFWLRVIVNAVTLSTVESVNACQLFWPNWISIVPMPLVVVRRNPE